MFAVLTCQLVGGAVMLNYICKINFGEDFATQKNGEQIFNLLSETETEFTNADINFLRF